MLRIALIAAALMASACTHTSVVVTTVVTKVSKGSQEFKGNELEALPEILKHLPEGGDAAEAYKEALKGDDK